MTPHASMLSAALALVLGACAAAPEAQPLPGSRWVLQSASGGALQATAAGSGVTLAFEADRIGGHGGCNQYSGSYSIQGDVLRVGPVTATKRACLDGGSEVERAWFQALSAPLTLARDARELTLRSADGSVLRFVPAAD